MKTTKKTLTELKQDIEHYDKVVGDVAERHIKEFPKYMRLMFGDYMHEDIESPWGLMGNDPIVQGRDEFIRDVNIKKAALRKQKRKQKPKE
jgi:hypothetical protein